MRGTLHFDGMAWPNPNDPHEIEWALRYGTPSREQMLAAASFIAAYRQLVDLPTRERNKRIASIRAGCGRSRAGMPG
jgi:hypothetical protein